MSASLLDSDGLLRLLQHTYFDNIDSADASSAARAFNEDAEWIHTQVWEHDGHSRRNVDTLKGRQAIEDFLAARIGEMQAIGFKHKVHAVVCDGKSGAFRANVVGKEGEALPFFGWVELENGLISTYIIHPER